MTVPALIRILVVEDSPVQRELLLHLLAEDGGFEVVGTAKDGREAVEMAARLKPAIVLMDYHLPHIDGIEATRQIMEQSPVPIVIASATIEPDDVAFTFDAVRNGALSVVMKPPGPHMPRHARLAADMLRSLKLMSEVRVVRRWPRLQAPLPAVPAVAARGEPVALVALGASTGGPVTVSQILAALPAELPVPLLLVQHLAAGFTTGFATWLGQKTPLKVRVAEAGLKAEAGTVYLGPDGFHLGVAGNRSLTLSKSPPEEGFRPSINRLFRSVAKACGRSAMGVILTGMGQDGVAGLEEMRRAGSVTVAQDEESSVVFGMPREAIRRDVVDHILSPAQIVSLIRALAAARAD